MVKRDYLFFCLICIAILMLSGCASRGTGLVWWNPTTWASRAAPAAADRAGEKRDEAAAKAGEAERAAVQGAHREMAKTGEVLAAAPDSKPVRLARRFTANGLALLAQVRPLTPEESMELRSLVADLLSENERVAQKAELRQLEDEAAAAKLGRDLEAARRKLEQREAALAAANANLLEAYNRENALAAQVRNFWFIAGLLVFLWVAGNVLPMLARFIPALAPVATAANVIAAPALAYAESRARDGLAKVGHAMAAVRAKLPAVAEQVTELFDQAADDDHKRVIGAAASAAPRTPP